MLTEDEVDNAIEAAKAEVARHRLALDAADKRLCDLRVKRAEIKYGVRVGSIVRRTRDGTLCRVAEVDGTRGGDSPWLVANPAKRNGQFGGSTCVLYMDWEIVQP